MRLSSAYRFELGLLLVVRDELLPGRLRAQLPQVTQHDSELVAGAPPPLLLLLLPQLGAAYQLVKEARPAWWWEVQQGDGGAALLGGLCRRLSVRPVWWEVQEDCVSAARSNIFLAQTPPHGSPIRT